MKIGFSPSLCHVQHFSVYVSVQDASALCNDIYGVEVLNPWKAYLSTHSVKMNTNSYTKHKNSDIDGAKISVVAEPSVHEILKHCFENEMS